MELFHVRPSLVRSTLSGAAEQSEEEAEAAMVAAVEHWVPREAHQRRWPHFRSRVSICQYPRAVRSHLACEKVTLDYVAPGAKSDLNLLEYGLTPTAAGLGCRGPAQLCLRLKLPKMHSELPEPL